MAKERSPDFGALLRRRRHEALLTQEELAERAGLSVRAISDLERGINRTARGDSARMLADALGLPGEEQAVFEAAARGRRYERGAAETSTNARALMLHVPPTTLVGRKRELAEIATCLRRPEVRLLTLVGPGGVGKTRLALGAAVDHAPAVDSVWFVPLASIADPDFVPSAIAAALNVREVDDQPLVERLIDAMGDGAALLILDNFEHLLPGATVVSDLLAACRRLRILVSSRIPLRLQGEHLFAVPPLAIPGWHRPQPLPEFAAVDAVALFVQRARAVQRHFALTEQNARPIAELCARLDGLPLAVELAAAKSNVLSPAELLARLDNRLALLGGGPRDAPQRLRTMRAAIDWSHDLLTAQEQIAFRRLSVFAGGCSLTAAAAVCADAGIASPDVLDLLTRFVEQSLVEAHTGQGVGRYRLLEPVRQDALQRLRDAGEEAQTRERHLAWCVAMADASAGSVGTTDWFERLEEEHGNVRAALSWAAADGQPEIGLRLTAALWPFWHGRGYLSEGRAWLETMLARNQGVGDDPDVGRHRATALLGAGVMAYTQGDQATAAALLEDALALYRRQEDGAGVAAALRHGATVAQNQGDHVRAMVLIEESLVLHRQLGDERGIAGALLRVGGLARDFGQYDRAMMAYEEGLKIYRTVGDAAGEAAVLNALGKAVRDQGDYVRAVTLHRNSLKLGQGLGDRYAISRSLDLLGLVTWHLGDTARAIELSAESLVLAREIGDRWGISRHPPAARTHGRLHRRRRTSHRPARGELGIVPPPGRPLGTSSHAARHRRAGPERRGVGSRRGPLPRILGAGPPNGYPMGCCRVHRGIGASGARPGPTGPRGTTLRSRGQRAGDLRHPRPAA